VLSAGSLIVGAIAALVVGLSKTALPGAGLIATPLVAMVVSGRLIPGTTLPILIAADLFAVAWYRHHTRWDLLRPLIAWVATGFAAGTGFFIAIGSSTRSLEVVIGVTILSMVTAQLVRMVRRSEPARATPLAAAGFGTAGGFTTFVSNTAGPVINTYLLRLGLGKHELVGTSAWFYFAVNVAKIPIYLAIGAWTAGGPFFTAQSLTYDAVLIPAVVAGVYSGRALFAHIPQRLFLGAVLILSAVGALKLLL
jgi:uncharacterized membrane protein YfcA